MKTRKKMLMTVMLFLSANMVNAQLFETRCTHHAGDSILTLFANNASVEQLQVRKATIASYDNQLLSTEKLETFYDGYHLGMIIYKNDRPFNLIGFWDPSGKPIEGGSLVDGTGEVKTPFNRSLVVNFKHESVEYIDGLKKGPVFYYCDCAHVLRRGTFNNNVKEGVWEEFKPSGEFIKRKRIKVVKEKKDDDKIKVKDWIGPSHCMMKAPDEEIKCPGK